MAIPGSITVIFYQYYSNVIMGCQTCYEKKYY